MLSYEVKAKSFSFICFLHSIVLINNYEYGLVCLRWLPRNVRDVCVVSWKRVLVTYAKYDNTLNKFIFSVKLLKTKFKCDIS